MLEHDVGVAPDPQRAKTLPVDELGLEVLDDLTKEWNAFNYIGTTAEDLRAGEHLLDDPHLHAGPCHVGCGGVAEGVPGPSVPRTSSHPGVAHPPADENRHPLWADALHRVVALRSDQGAGGGRVFVDIAAGLRTAVVSVSARAS
jgi:hypothetical protein